MNLDAIRAFILKDLRNFSIARAVFEVWPQCREQIAQEFFKRLEAALLQKLPGWHATPGQDYYEVPWATFKLGKAIWGNEYEIPLQFVRLGRSIQFGVARTAGSATTRPFSKELLEAITKLHPTAKAALPSWDALVVLRTPAPDWQEPEVLWRMHSEPSFLKEVSEQLLGVAQTAEPILDLLSKKTQ